MMHGLGFVELQIRTEIVICLLAAFLMVCDGSFVVVVVIVFAAAY